MKIAVFSSFVLINILIAMSNSGTVRYRIHHGITTQINHTVWATVYTLACAATWFLTRSVANTLSLLPLHLSVFPVAYNLMSGNAPFFLSRTTSAWTDHKLIDLGFRSTEVPNFVAFLISLSLLLISLP